MKTCGQATGPGQIEECAFGHVGNPKHQRVIRTSNQFRLTNFSAFSEAIQPNQPDLIRPTHSKADSYDLRKDWVNRFAVSATFLPIDSADSAPGNRNVGPWT